ncbi:putative MFS family arabinose efflux permease [Anoxybacillus tepidamans]|uniref:Putative MFS family arabinose efflux permease n=1 Tax=Anoxybacteroides tepidamans TaxID=265948 RepID=A0A7W8ISV9_9BACL|nr:putative MFS family arabinose efflux permease [Anoxybacillus tepidamans]
MKKQNNLLIFILTVGVFSIVNTQLGIIGILPLIADHFHVSISDAGLMVSLFTLAIAISAPITPLLFSGIERKKVMLFVLGVFILGNVVSAFASNFTVALIAYVFPAIFFPVYISLVLTVAATSVSKEEAPKAVSKVFIGISASMVLGIPATSFIAKAASLPMSILFFAIVNAIAFIATVLWMPSTSVNEKLSYGAQVSILKRPIVWFSITVLLF